MSTARKTDWKRKYHWVLTWPGEEKEDWCAFHVGLLIGRVARDKTSPIPLRGTFTWNGNCSEWWGFKRFMPQNGRCAEAWEAAKAIEDWYDAGLERSGPRPAWVEEIINRHPDLNPPGWRDK